MTANVDRASFQGDENVLKLDNDMVVQLCDYTKSHWFAHFKSIDLHN